MTRTQLLKVQKALQTGALAVRQVESTRRSEFATCTADDIKYTTEADRTLVPIHEAMNLICSELQRTTKS